MDRKVKHESYRWYDDHMMLAIVVAPPHVMIGRGVVNLVRVITKDDSRDVVFEWELDELILS